MPFETIAPPNRQCRKVSHQLRQVCDAGEYAVGDWLPPEHILAGRPGISRPAIREVPIEVGGYESGDNFDRRLTPLFTRLSSHFVNSEPWRSALAGHGGFASRLREAIRSARAATGDHLRNSQERFLRSFSTSGIRQGVALKEVAGAR